MRTLNHQLPPEFENALKIINRKYEEYRLYDRQSNGISDEIWLYNNRTTIINNIPKIREIPSGDDWRWNQSKRRYKVKLQSGIFLELQKLVPRKFKKDSNTLPTLKLWRGMLHDLEHPITIFWCEKGLNRTDESLLILSEYSFLARFMDSRTANEFWPIQKTCI